jgi:hypothetical protein
LYTRRSDVGPLLRILVHGMEAVQVLGRLLHKSGDEMSIYFVRPQTSYTGFNEPVHFILGTRKQDLIDELAAIFG